MLSTKRKIALTIVVVSLVSTLGGAYQFYYLEERGEYERAIRRIYRKTYGTDPTSKQLRHLSMLALDRYGPTEFYRTEADYEQFFKDVET